jgi:hypothetical protein
VKGLSRVILNVFHPLLISSWMFFVLSWLNKYAFAGLDIGKMGIMIGINTFFFPAFCVFLMWRLEFIPSLKMENKQDRTIPFFAVMICYIWSFMVVKKVMAPGIIQLFVLGATISVVLSFIVNIFFRLSLHMVGMGAVLLFLMLIALMGAIDVAHLFIGSILIAGLVGAATMKENNHSLTELYFGLLVGFMGQLVGFVVLSRGVYPIL